MVIGLNIFTELNRAIVPEGMAHYLKTNKQNKKKANTIFHVILSKNAQLIHPHLLQKYSFLKNNISKNTVPYSPEIEE